MKQEDCGPLWQMEQAVKTHESLIKSHREDAERSMKRAEEAELKADEYRKAVEALKAAGVTK